MDKVYLNIKNFQLDYTSKVPMYIQLAVYLTDQARNIEETSQLPTIRELSSMLDVSIITVKKAYDVLEENNVAYPVPGKGWFVYGKMDEGRHEAKLREIQDKLMEVVKIVENEPLISTDDVYDMLEELLK